MGLGSGGVGWWRLHRCGLLLCLWAAVFATATAAAQQDDDAGSVHHEVESAESPRTAADAFAFLSADSPSAPRIAGVDVEDRLDTIASELDSLFKTDTQLAAEQQANVEAQHLTAREKRNSRAKRRHARQVKKARQHALAFARAQRAEEAKAKAAKAQAKAAPQARASSPSPRQRKLIGRLDAYRTARGHADVAALESGVSTTAKAKATTTNFGYGYSMPSAYAPGVVGGVPPVAPAFQGQVAVNPLFATPQPVVAANPWAVLTLQAPLAQQQAAAAASSNVAGVGMLLQALKKVQQEQEASALMSRLSTMIAAASAPRVPAAVASPYNYGQTLVPTPAGYVNPNLQPHVYGPRLLPGQLPGQSPAYPSFIPAQTQAVGVVDDQPNPFADNMP